MLYLMSIESLPEEFGEFRDLAVDAIRRAYAVNANRYDLEVGDDALVFAIGVYRNSWFLLEQDVAVLPGWSSSRPLGSLVIVGAGRRIHVYRCGRDGDVDLDAFRLDDERSSATKRLVDASNTNPLAFDFGDLDVPVVPGELQYGADLRELVIIHAGNPEDGCCGIWVGAPVSSDELSASPWAWIAPLWLPEGSAVSRDELRPTVPQTTRHHEMQEPDITLKPVAEDDVEKSGDR